MRADVERMMATVRAHEALVQALRIRIARLQRQRFGARGSAPAPRGSSARSSSSSWPSRRSRSLPRPPESRSPTTRTRSRRWRSHVLRSTLLHAGAGPGSAPARRASASCSIRARPAPRLRGSAAAGGRGRQRDPGADHGAAEGRRDGTAEEVLPALRADHPGASALPADPAEHGRPGPARPCPGVEVRRPSSPLPPERDLRPHGRRHPRLDSGRLVRPRHAGARALGGADPGQCHGLGPPACR